MDGEHAIRGRDGIAGCEPHDVDYTTIGEFYHKIESGFSCIPQATLFIGGRPVALQLDRAEIAPKP